MSNAVRREFFADFIRAAAGRVIAFDASLLPSWSLPEIGPGSKACGGFICGRIFIWRQGFRFSTATR
jgi:hypothetical protein